MCVQAGTRSTPRYSFSSALRGLILLYFDLFAFFLSILLLHEASWSIKAKVRFAGAFALRLQKFSLLYEQLAVLFFGFNETSPRAKLFGVSRNAKPTTDSSGSGWLGRLKDFERASYHERF